VTIIIDTNSTETETNTTEPEDTGKTDAEKYYEALDE
jgi:hypothetical protein